jgi:hypothetical protein
MKPSEKPRPPGYDDYKNDHLAAWPMNRTEVLFVGGIADGEWGIDTGRDYYQRAGFSRNPSPAYSAIETPVAVAPVEVSTYRRERFRTDDREFALYVHDELTVSEAFVKLMKGYRP